MFDLKKYLKGDSSINESFQSTTLRKEIVSNPANNFNYLTTYSSNNSSAADYTLNRYIFRNSKIGEMVMSSHDTEDLNSKRLFKYVPFGKYIHDLVYFLSIYAKYKNGVDGVTKENFMAQYRRYMIIYSQWEKALNKGIFGNDMTSIQILEHLLGAPISDLTDSNFKRYTFKEAKKLGKTFTEMKNGAVSFFFSSGNFKSPDRTVTAKTIDLPEGGLIGISVGNYILYDITRNYYSECKEAVQAMKDYGFKDLYKLEMNDGATLDIPYLCGLKNFVEAKLGKESNHEESSDPTLLSPFCKTFSKGAFFKNRKFWQRESLSDIYDNDLKDLPDSKGPLCLQDMKSILDEMDIYDFAYNDFKCLLNGVSLNDPQRRLGNVFTTGSDPAFGGWGENPDDYVYVAMKDLEYPKGRFDDPDGSYYKKWTSGEFVPYVDNSNADQLLNIGKKEIDDDNTASKLSRLDKEFIYKSSNSSKEDYRAGRVKQHGHVMTPEEIQIKQNNLQRYASKLEALRNTNKDTKQYVDKINQYRKFLPKMEEAIDNYMEYGLVDDIREFKFKAAKNYYSNVFKDRHKMQDSLIRKRTTFIGGLTSLANLVLQFSQSNKNLIAERYHDAALDLSLFYREKLVGYSNTGKLYNGMTDEDCSKLDFAKVFKTMKEDIGSQCETLDDLVADFENL